jgi:hypothetical protein
MTTIIDPIKLAGLKQAAYVMGCLARNDSEQQIIETLDGDAQLFDIWKSFLRHNQWITETTEGWSVTAKGSMWSKRATTA